jgi:hypothetical protein
MSYFDRLTDEDLAVIRKHVHAGLPILELTRRLDGSIPPRQNDPVRDRRDLLAEVDHLRAERATLLAFVGAALSGAWYRLNGGASGTVSCNACGAELYSFLEHREGEHSKDCCVPQAQALVARLTPKE